MALRAEEIRERVRAYPRWHYTFDLQGVRTPGENPQRHIERKRYFFDPMVQFCGGSLAGKRVLDLGCNAGFWSLMAIESGAAFVHGIEGRQMHVEQARLVFEAKGIAKARYRFEQKNLMEDGFELEGYDIVMCLGLLYHVAKPVRLMELMHSANPDILLIDTFTAPLTGAAFKLTTEDPDDPKNAVGSELILVPSRGAVVELVKNFGYDVIVLKPAFSSWVGSEVYKNGSRRAFVCSRTQDLSGFAGLRDAEAWPERAPPAPPVSRLDRGLNRLRRWRSRS